MFDLKDFGSTAETIGKPDSQMTGWTIKAVIFQSEGSE